MTKDFVFLLVIFISFFQNSFAQNKIYKDSIIQYQKNYINTHEAVGKEDRKFLHFYSVNEDYCVVATFERINDVTGFEMNNTSDKKSKYLRSSFLTFK